MAKGRRKRRREAESLLLSPESQETKRLLIFDLNKVLISKVKNTSFYHIRPFASEFLHDLSKVYTFAVWTSMKKNTVKKIIKSLFQLNVQTLQPQAKSSSISDIENYSSQAMNTAATAVLPRPSLLFKWTQNKCTASVNSSSSSSSSTSLTGATEIESTCIGKEKDDDDNDDNDEETDTESSLVLAKDLSRVWKEFPRYHQYTTVRLLLTYLTNIISFIQN